MNDFFHGPRYLVSFHPKRVAHHFTDLLIIGSGLAGLRAAMAADPGLDVMLVTKEDAQQSNSQYAQGGIAAVWDPEDRFELHVEDTLRAGKGLCHEDIVELVVRDAPVRVRELIEWGTEFDSTGGILQLGLEGGHSFHRIVHALGDATGREVIRAVLERSRRLPNLRIVENTFTIDLLTDHGRCAGALAWSERTGISAIWAKETILATGGCGQIFRETTNPPVATGDGLAMAFRAGARVRDLEFMQFHPTVLYVAGSSRTLISEAVRGEGAILRDRTGYRFMPDCDSRAELAPRDVVAKAIVAQMAKTQHPCVYLDLSHLEAARVRERFPGITAECEKCGLDFARDLIPVRPGAHYMVGGVETDAAGRTTLPGLWAAGEVASTGLHGANRLASNSLLEALVFGYLCGKGASERAGYSLQAYQALPVRHHARSAPREHLDLRDIRNALTSTMFRDVGIERTETGLREAADSIHFWRHYVLDREFDGPSGWELQNMLLLAGLICRSALERTESRGTHFRVDFPESRDATWRCHLAATRGDNGFEHQSLPTLAASTRC